MQYLIGGILILAMICGLAYKTYQAGANAVKTEWAEANRKEEARKVEEMKRRDLLTAQREAENAKAYSKLDARYRAVLIGLRKPSGDGQAQPLSAAASVFACADRQADAAGRLEQLEIGVLGLLERGDKAIVRTETCRAWLDEQGKVKQ